MLIALIIIVALVLAVYIYMNIEARWLKVERLDFSHQNTGLKIVHLTDLHVYLTQISADKIRRVINVEKPDVILISGDYINTPLHASEFLEYLSTISKGYRTIICLGNHDLRAFSDNPLGLSNFISEIEALQVEVLRNENTIVEKDGKKYNIIGIDDLRNGHPDVEKAIAGCIPGSPKIAITHNPDLSLKIPGKIVDYLFCGHFHGGQIWMPFNLEFFLLRNEQLCRMGIKRGFKRINDINVYINRGTGNAVVPLRFMSPPEILVSIIP